MDLDKNLDSDCLWVCQECCCASTQEQMWTDANYYNELGQPEVFDSTERYRWCDGCEAEGREGEQKYLDHIERSNPRVWHVDDVSTQRSNEEWKAAEDEKKHQEKRHQEEIDDGNGVICPTCSFVNTCWRSPCVQSCSLDLSAVPTMRQILPDKYPTPDNKIVIKEKIDFE